MRSLLLDRTTWDLVVDSSRNIAVCYEPYAVAQDVASAIRTFKSEIWYDVSFGIPYLEEVFGKFSPTLYAALVNAEALKVPLVDTVKTTITGFRDRALTGAVEVTDTSGISSTITIGDVPPVLAEPSGRYLSGRYVSPHYVE